MFSSHTYFRVLVKDFKTLDSLLYLSEEVVEQPVVIKLFKTCLEKHDYLYMYADDNRAYNNGLLESKILTEATKNFSFLKDLLDQYYKRKESKESKGA